MSKLLEKFHKNKSVKFYVIKNKTKKFVSWSRIGMFIT